MIAAIATVAILLCAWVAQIIFASFRGRSKSTIKTPRAAPPQRPAPPQSAAPTQNAAPSQSAAPVQDTAPPQPPDPVMLSGKCWVIDGDTISIDRTHIRLWGIDAPELHHPYGRIAKSALLTLTKGRNVQADVVGRCPHGRIVAKCTADGDDLSARMVEQGHALDWPKFSSGAYRHLEPSGIRKRYWRADARMKGRYFGP